MLRINIKTLILFFATILSVSCGDKDDENISIDRSALVGTWNGNNYECIFDKPREVKLVITKGPDPLGLKIDFNNGEYVLDADYGEDDNRKAFVGEYETSSYSVTISGILYDDGVMKLTVLLDDDACGAMLTKN